LRHPPQPRPASIIFFYRKFFIPFFFLSRIEDNA
jgi:hypothetical protein